MSTALGAILNIYFIIVYYSFWKNPKGKMRVKHAYDRSDSSDSMDSKKGKKKRHYGMEDKYAHLGMPPPGP